MDTIAIVGSGEAALALLLSALHHGLDIVAVSPQPDAQRLAVKKRAGSRLRSTVDAFVRFTDDLDEVGECSLVIDCTEDAAPEARAQALRALEDRMTSGAILASAEKDLTGLSALLSRPAQFVGIRPVAGQSRPRVTITEETALGVADAADRFSALLGSHESASTTLSATV